MIILQCHTQADPQLTLRLRGHVPLLIDICDIVGGVHNNRTIEGGQQRH